VDQLKRLRQPVESHLTGTTIDKTRLDAARRVADAILDEHKATVDGDGAAARAAVTAAARLEPANLYVNYLGRKQHE
jgi:spermidine synthase